MTEFHPLSKKELREFGLVMAGVLGGVFGLLLPLVLHRPILRWPWGLAIPFFVLALTAPQLLRWPQRIWMTFGEKVGWINTWIVLGVAYVLLILPMGLLQRALGRDPLRRKFSKTIGSYRVEKKEVAGMETPY